MLHLLQRLIVQEVPIWDLFFGNGYDGYDHILHIIYSLNSHEHLEIGYVNEIYMYL